MSQVSDISFNRAFGELIRARRDAKGLTQAEVAKLAFGKEERKGDISKLERGKINNPHSFTISLVSNALDIPNEVIEHLRTSTLDEEYSPKAPNTNIGIINIPTRRCFILRASELLNSTKSYRAIVTGPFFCHPDWFFERKAKKLQYPDFDLQQKQFLLTKQNTSHDIRYILSNSKRYEEKVFKYIDQSERKRFFLDCIKEIDRIWGINRKSGPDICCTSLGHLHIPYIFDNSVLLQFRTQQMTPTKGGTEFLNDDFVKVEQVKFDTIFEEKSDGQVNEIDKLINFFTSLIT